MGKVTLKIEFSGNDAGLYAAVIADPVRNVETGAGGKMTEKTTFIPGDDYYFLVQHDPRLRVTGIRTSSGAVVPAGAVERHHSEEVSFADAAATAELERQVVRQEGGVLWYGNAPILRRDGRRLAVASGDVPAVGRVTYASQWSAYMFRCPSLKLNAGEEWPVLIVIDLEATG